MSAMRNKTAPANIPMTDLNASKRLNFFLPQSTPQSNAEDPLANYSLQGVMQWLNGEYRRYERERNLWEIERAKLVAQVSLLTGTRNGAQKVQDDLMRQNRILERRIKALEHALKSERANNGKEWVESPPEEPPESVEILPTHPDRQRSRKLLESCLREINYLMAPPPQEYVASEEELPRKLPRTDIPKVSDAEVPDVSWDFTPPPPDLDSKTVLERQNHPRSSAKSAFQTRTFQHIHTLRSHLSPVRALIACNSASTLSDETAFVSAGDDSTVKFWRVSRIGPNPKKKGNFDILPQITFRGHTGIVTCLAESGGNIWSGGSDGGIRGWKVPSPTRDAYGSSVDAGSVSLLGHTNCIWSLAVPGSQPLLASAAADATVKIWDTRSNSRSPLRANFKHHSNPTCVSWDWDGRGLIIGWQHSAVELWDVELGRAVTTFEHADFGKSQVNCLVKHPTQTLIIAGYEDRNIRIFDTRTRDCISSWAAHLDSISSLAMSPDGTTLLSGAHDSSVRFWDLADKTCLQEALPPHRQRGDEGVLAVAWGDDEVAGSAGADGVVKLYVEQQ